MSLAGIWSGNIHQLRNSFGSSCSCKFFRFQTSVGSEKAIGSRRCRLQPITAKVGGQNHKSESGKPCNIDLRLLDGSIGSSTSLSINQSGYELKSIQHHDIQQKIINSRIVEWPAVVLVFDIETTGFGRKERIIEIAVRDLFGGRNSTFQSLVNPQKGVLNSHIHGITTCMVSRPGVPRFLLENLHSIIKAPTHACVREGENASNIKLQGMEDLIPILIQFVRSRQIPGKPVVWVAHNGRCFDVPFIINEFKRCSVEVPSDWLFVDTLPLARQLVKPDGSKLSSVSLNSLKAHFEIALDGQAHRAMHDVNVLSLVLQKMSFTLKFSVAELMETAFRAKDVDKSSS